jgi:beta-lactamase class A
VGRIRDLEAEFRAIGASMSGTWTAALTDLTTDEHIAIDERRPMPPASLAKVPVLTALYQAVDDGAIRLDDRTTYAEQHRSLGSGVLSMMSPGVEMSVRDAAVLMMTISDNSATNMCIDLVGLDAINAKMRALGLTETALMLRLGDPRIKMDARNMSLSSARDIVRLLTLIARREAVSPEGCDDMLRIMRRCTGRAELSKLLPWNELNMLDNPRENWVAEKGGAMTNGVRCGGGIFRSTRGFFALAVFCEGGLPGPSNHESDANLFLGRMGKAAWDALAG